jgi:diguanylate cyclase
VPAAALRLEITEHVMSHDLERATNTLDRLRATGVTISLDDFGTGYSSLLRLSSMPVDEIKIDRVFVSRLSEGPRAIGIVRTLIGLAHALEVPAIAEGVEDEAQLRPLVEMGCDGVQGFHIAQPMTADVAAEWFHTRTTTPAPAPPAADVTRRLPRRPPATRIHRPISPAEGAAPTRT